MRKLPHTAAEDLLELIMRRYERASTMITSNRPVEDWGKLLGDTAAVTALLDRLLHHAHVLKCGPRSWRTRVQTTGSPQTGVGGPEAASVRRARAGLPLGRVIVGAQVQRSGDQDLRPGQLCPFSPGLLLHRLGPDGVPQDDQPVLGLHTPSPRLEQPFVHLLRVQERPPAFLDGELAPEPQLSPDPRRSLGGRFQQAVAG